MRKWFIIILWSLLTLSVLSVVGVFWAISEGKLGNMPSIEDLQNPINRYASQVYSSDGKLMGTYSLSRENRVMIDYSQLPKHLVNALVATEDARFFEHSGIDFYALGRAIVKRGILRQKSAGGGSTITQQLAKQLYSDVAHSSRERMLQKPIEWVIAVKLERAYTKEEIIALYLNKFDFLNNAVGIKTASNTYFSKEPSELSLTQAATLVGMCKNPSYFNPKRYPERSEERRNVVLNQMVKEGYLSRSEYDSCVKVKLVDDLKFHVADHTEGIAPYFREFLRHYMMAKEPMEMNYDDHTKYVLDRIAWDEDPLYGWCNKNKKRNGEPYNIYTDGLKIYTSIDSRMQQYAEEACREHVAGYLQPAFDKANKSKRNAPYPNSKTDAEVKSLMRKSIRQSERYRVLKEAGASDEEIDRSFHTAVHMQIFTYHGERDTVMTPFDSIRYIKSFLRTGFVSMDPSNGHVKAYVGGLDFTQFAYDMAAQGRRQVGSTIKPFLYSLAMQNGLTPCSEAPNEQRTYEVPGSRPWTPRNGSRARYGEMVTLKWGLQQSNNWISAYLINRLGPDKFLKLLREYGIRNPEIKATLSLCLGTCENTVAEMVSGYTAFVNGGDRVAPLFVTEIRDNNGHTLDTFYPRKNKVISTESAHKMIYMLRAVVDGGTGSRLRNRYGITAQMGGKTGTTNSNSDGWFMGVAPRLVSGCWVGGEDRDIHFDNMTYGQGAAMGLPVYALFMKRVYADESLGYSQSEKFDIPSSFDPCYSEDNMEVVDEEMEEKLMEEEEEGSESIIDLMEIVSDEYEE
ncbi:MAG: transglycosylase domain-containing protein [Prevotella sp.]|nr:transglycosylase domain-containing protein [Prevotella sp.]